MQHDGKPYLLKNNRSYSNERTNDTSLLAYKTSVVFVFCHETQAQRQYVPYGIIESDLSRLANIFSTVVGEGGRQLGSTWKAK